MYKKMMQSILKSDEYSLKGFITEVEIRDALNEYERDLGVMDESITSKMMQNLLDRKETEIRKNIKQRAPVLDEADRKHLEEYASVLFDCIASEPKALEYMNSLVKVYYEYRYYKSSYSIEHDAKSRIIRKKNETREEELVAFKNKIKSLINQMGGYHLDKEKIGSKFIHTHKGHQLKIQLKYAYDNPEEYIPIVEKMPKCNKNDIESFLRSLKLQGKSKVIKAFVKGIK